RVLALKDRPGQNPPVEVMWVYTPTISLGGPGLDTYSPALADADLDLHVPLDETHVIRTAPLVWDFGEGPTVVFGWLPTDLNAADARISAVGLEADMNGGTVTFTHRWTRDDFDAWKSSPALVPQPEGPPLIVMGYGLGIGSPPTQSGSVGQCVSGQVFGGVVALDWQGEAAWTRDFGNLEGNVRASPATGDLDGNGVMDVVLPVGCFGGLHIYDGAGGQELWSLQLGPRAQNSPSLGDIDGDGQLEIVLGSYDGRVWVLDGGVRIFLPLMIR
ncbi:MAG TPA: VCBS repeat-containing protein, partial [Anaerolineales bacterium]|nr:VCBS repeat-containing protein [Anaerolineales bacterium]